MIFSGVVDIALAMFLSALDGATWVFPIEVCFCWGCFSWVLLNSSPERGFLFKYFRDMCDAYCVFYRPTNISCICCYQVAACSREGSEAPGNPVQQISSPRGSRESGETISQTNAKQLETMMTQLCPGEIRGWRRKRRSGFPSVSSLSIDEALSHFNPQNFKPSLNCLRNF